MSPNDSMTFDDVTPMEVPVRIGDRQYILREADEGAACAYRNAIINSARTNDQGKVIGHDGLADVEPLLVSLCLYRANGEGKMALTKEGAPDRSYLLGMAGVKALPSRVVKPLFERAKQISGLDDRTAAGEGSDPKAPPDATPPTSG